MSSSLGEGGAQTPSTSTFNFCKAGSDTDQTVDGQRMRPASERLETGIDVGISSEKCEEETAGEMGRQY
jgi:hypothetical protein